MWATWSDEGNTSTLSSMGTWARVSVCLHACFWVHVSPVRAGLTERANGIRLTCVIQLGCGREVCPHPSAAGDKEPGEGGGEGSTSSCYWGFSKIEICLFVGDRPLLGLGHWQQVYNVWLSEKVRYNGRNDWVELLLSLKIVLRTPSYGSTLAPSV